VHAVRARCEGDVEPIVHDEELSRGTADREERTREREEVPAAEILLAQLDGGPAGREPRERGARVRHEIASQAAVRDEVDNGDDHS
jgi:hypothetical protein